MTIAEFLEARIAEDEREASNCLANRANSKRRWHRVLAECAAKRVVIAIFKDRCPEVFDGEKWVSPIAALAAIYADHPDYQREWAVG